MNIFISELKEKHVYSLIKNKSTMYFPYIDNIFIVQIKSKSELKYFMNKTKQNDQSTKFDFRFWI